MRLNIIIILILLLSYLIVCGVGYFIVYFILRSYQLPKRGLKHAGAIIGVLERIFTLTLVLIGQYTAIALILTAKSITRFNELKKRDFAEYYLIGTLSSILFSILIGIFTLWLIGVKF